MRSTEPNAAVGASAEPMLRIDNLDVFYGQAHALQGVSLSLPQGVLAVVGRNGMGKTTLCKAITGLVPASGSVQFAGQELLGSTPDQITRLGVAYVPQGRRVWRSLTVDETLQLAARTARQGAWTVDRVYQVFPRLAERRGNGGAQLSGGEQQMLAIGRALLFNPRVLVMDEPTEGLAPVIVEQVATLLKALADERSMSVLLIEQNLGVALEVADQVAIMVNGRIAHCLPAQTLAADRALQQRLLGLKAGAATEEAAAVLEDGGSDAGRAKVLRVVRAHGSDQPPLPDYSFDVPAERALETARALPVFVPEAAQPRQWTAAEGATADRAIYLAGSWGEQPRELAYVKRCLEQLGARVVAVDIAGSGFSSAQVGVRELLRFHPSADRKSPATAEGVSPELLAEAFPAYLATRRDVGGLLVLARGSSAAAGCAGALCLPMGLPKMVVSDRPLAGTMSDVLVMAAPIGELHRVSETLLAHAASAMVGMLRESTALHRGSKPLVCITSLDLVDAAVRNARRALGDAFDGLVLDMAAGGAETLERLALSGLVAGVIDLAPVDVSQAHVSGDLSAVQRRFQALRASGVPYLLVPSLLEVATFSLGQPVPARLLQREVLSSAQDGSIVPVSRDEVERMSEWLAVQLEGFSGPVHLALAQPSVAMLARLGGGGQSLATQDLLHRSLLRSIRPQRALRLVDSIDTLHDMRFGEALGHAMRDLIQNRASV
ncbi:ATP-binding cassette domain-containing protein [Hydrogenophaga sp. OTU3427]|uniref:ATP-binding cassette domain-containing protein n=1 Tax=Hydrogenophaga sp. OTU3427 TaxID=3043856 RepID=UPI00313DBFBA